MLRLPSRCSNPDAMTSSGVIGYRFSSFDPTELLLHTSRLLRTSGEEFPSRRRRDRSHADVVEHHVVAEKMGNLLDRFNDLGGDQRDRHQLLGCERLPAATSD